MAKFEDVRRANLKGAEDESIQGALKALKRLRDAGVARGRPPLLPPHAGRYGELPKARRKAGVAALKMTFHA
jgi:hypothetical protein